MKDQGLTFVGKLRKFRGSALLLCVVTILFIPHSSRAQQVPTRTPCSVAAEPDSTITATVQSVDAKFRRSDWGELDAELRSLADSLATRVKCRAQIPATNDNYVFVWEGSDKVPHHYLLHPIVARRPRVYMPADAPESQWYEVILAKSLEDASRVITAWAATPGAPSGIDMATWLQSLLTSAIPAGAGLFPILPDPRQLKALPGADALFVRMSWLTTDIVPAKLTVTATVQAVPAGIGALAMIWKTRTEKIYGSNDGARKLLDAYLRSFEMISCSHPRGCEEDALKRIAEIWKADGCRSDPDCQAITASAREWSAGLPKIVAETRQATLGAEPPKRWAFGTYVGIADYPSSVSRAEVVRVRAGADSKLTLDPFTRAVTGFIAAWSVRAHQPDYWSLANVGPYAGIMILPNIGAALGLQWRVFRQMAIAGGPIWLWHPTGRVGDVLSSSQPLDKDRLRAWTFGVTFTLDGR